MPADLADLEGRLARRSVPAASPDHRARVLAAVGRELAAGRRPWWQRRATWRFAAGLAAAFFLWTNLSMSAVNRTRPVAEGPVTSDEIRDACRELRAALPGLSEREAWGQAILLEAGSRLAPAPLPRATRADLETRKNLEEVRAWAMR